MELKSTDPKIANMIIGRKYKLKEQLGKGSFGQIFRAVVKGTDEQVAVKVEKRKPQGNMVLSKESKILSDLSGKPGFPRLIAFGKEDSFHYMVLTLLGANINTLLKESRGKFDLKTTLMIADQVLTQIQLLHERGYVHRDIKPHNFLIGRGSTEKNIFLIDFGLSQSYRDTQGKHISFSTNKGLVGTARYCSVNAHLGYELSRRDDLESIGYMLIYFLKGKLPWQNAKGASKHEKYKVISDMKANLSVETLCKGLPKEFGQYLTTVKNLSFYETPNYKTLKIMFRTLFMEKGFEFDHCYCWLKYQTTDSRSIQSRNSRADNDEGLNASDMILSKGGSFVNKLAKGSDTKKFEPYGVSKSGQTNNQIKFEGPFMVAPRKSKISQDMFDDPLSKITISGEEEIPIEIDLDILPSQKVHERVYNKLERANTNHMAADDWNLPANFMRTSKRQKSSIIAQSSQSADNEFKKYSIFRSKTSKKKGMTFSEPPSSEGKKYQVTERNFF